MTNPPTPPLSNEESPQKPMSDQWIKDFRLWTNPPIEKEAIEQGDKPFPPDPDAGYVRPHAEIHADLLKVNLENSELRRSLSDKPEERKPMSEDKMEGLLRQSQHEDGVVRMLARDAIRESFVQSAALQITRAEAKDLASDRALNWRDIDSSYTHDRLWLKLKRISEEG